MRKPFTVVEIDGEPFKLCLDMNAMAEFKDQEGRPLGAFLRDLASIEEIGKTDQTEAGFRMMEILTDSAPRSFVYAVLRRYHPDITLEQAGGLIHHGNAQDVLGKLMEAAAEYMPKGDGTSVPFLVREGETATGTS